MAGIASLSIACPKNLNSTFSDHGLSVPKYVWLFEHLFKNGSFYDDVQKQRQIHELLNQSAAQQIKSISLATQEVPQPIAKPIAASGIEKNEAA